MRRIATIIIPIMLMALAAHATTLLVPSQYPTIQAGIDAAVDGDTVLVADGTYTGTGNKDIDFEGKAIVVISDGGAENCIIDCQISGRGFYFHSGEDSASILVGFKIINGFVADGGGGLRFESSSSPQILSCIISDDSSSSHGGGIYCDASSPILENCSISENAVSGMYSCGGGIYCDGSSPIITDCIIDGNTAPTNIGGIFLSSSEPMMTNCTISNNSSWNAGGIRCGGSDAIITQCTFYGNQSLGYAGAAIDCYGSNPTIANCTISGNTGANGPGGIKVFGTSNATIVNTIVEGSAGNGGINFASPATASITFSDFSNNESGNFTGSPPTGLGIITGVNANGDSCDTFNNVFLDPLFVDPVIANYNLQLGSPCIDAGDPTSPLDPDGTIADIGAFYFHHAMVILLTPHNPPIQIPAGGGDFVFDALITNTTGDPINFDAWTEVLLPYGFPYPLILRTGLTLGGGGNIEREITQYVPPPTPPGLYTYVGYVGVHPDTVLDSDRFDFEKLAGDAAPNHNYGWTCTGWDATAPLSSPEEFCLLPNCPNPFNPTTVLSYKLQVACRVNLTVYDVSGRKVTELVNGWRDAGVHKVTFDGARLASGIYFYRIQAEGFTDVKKMVLLK